MSVSIPFAGLVVFAVFGVLCVAFGYLAYRYDRSSGDRTGWERGFEAGFSDGFDEGCAATEQQFTGMLTVADAQALLEQAEQRELERNWRQS